MNNREKLISYALEAKGDYFKIKKFILDNKTPREFEGNVKAITILDDIYPRKLYELRYPPFVLFYKGNINLLKEECVGVVGSRQPCEYALNATSKLCSELDEVVISGLAKGIDRQAHIYSKKTIGVLGCGIDYIYPFDNKDLFLKLEKEGLILSEYPEKVLPINYHFPFRNRIICGLSNKLFVMQSNTNSGTMTSVNEMLELGREIEVLPYDIFDENGINNNNLIKEGATLLNLKDLKN